MHGNLPALEAVLAEIPDGATIVVGGDVAAGPSPQEVVDRLRARNEPAMEAPDLASSEPGPAEDAEASFVSWRIHRALEELPAKEREVVELAYWSGMSQSEVADYLNIPLGTVKTRTRSALSRLSDLLEEELA